MQELRLPSLGESVESGTVVSILVAVGDTVSADQPVIEVETDKVTAEVPAEHDGTVMEILVQVGDEISEGTVLIQLETDTQVEESNAEEAADAGTTPEVPTDSAPKEVKPVSVEKSQEKAPAASPGPTPQTAAKKGFRASPLARKIAREIGVDIFQVPSSKVSGRVSFQDVKDYAKQLNSSNGQVRRAQVQLPDFATWGTINPQPMSGIMQATSRNMQTAWSQVPHAWLQEKADITEIEQKRQLYKGQIKEQGGSLTLTALLVKVVAKALEKFPLFNTSVDEQQKTLIYKDYIHIGIAVDTERGLVVPKIEEANHKNITDISLALTEVSQKARNKKLTAADLEGATFSISNLGGIGTTAIFPIINYPQVAILGIAASKKEAVWLEDSFQPRLMMPMTLGFDHRVINGADAARFLQYIKQLLEDSFLLNL